MTTTADADTLSQLAATLRRISRRIDRQVLVAGLTGTEASVLTSIVRRGPLGVGDLAAREGINPTMLSRIIGKLESAGFVRRQPSVADRRSVQVAATRSGARMRDKLLAGRSRLLTERLGELEPEMIAAIMAAAPALDALAAALEPR